ncbi:MAG TPA: APC family permease [Terriglobales bacterium]|nr:APC family permease [Terriglobales bacterium]
MATKPQLPLIRAMGRWSLVALVINSIIGSGIFGLPSQLAAALGGRSPWAVLLAGVLIGIIMASFAEVASHFTQAGGPYLYARVAFGRLVGIEMGWMLWLAQLSAPAANANLFVIYLGEFWPGADRFWPRFLILTLLVGILALVNYRGVRAGAGISNFFTIAKLLPLGIVIAAGLIYIWRGGHVSNASTPLSHSGWLRAMLVMIFAYGGFESALTPMSEARDPRRDVPFSLFAALACCTVIYTTIQWITVHMLANASASERPLAAISRLALGKPGAVLVTIGALISFYGYLSAKILGVPRITYALAEEGDFPGVFAATDAKFRTPYVSIFFFAALTWGLALFGSFAWNLTLSAVARLVYYGVGCAALPLLRKKQPDMALFRLPGGPIFAMAGVLICMLLLTQVDLSKSMVLIATVVIAFFNWLWVRRISPKPTAEFEHRASSH